MNFSKWLDEQISRDDPIGDLARDAARDTNRPGPRAQYVGWVNHLQAKRASREALDALFSAWQEYSMAHKPGPLGIPAMLSNEESEELVGVLRAAGATIKYGEYGQWTWTYSPAEHDRMVAAAQAWWNQRLANRNR